MAEPKKIGPKTWLLRTRYKDPLTNEWREKKFTDETKAKTKNQETIFLSKLMNGQNMKSIGLVDFIENYIDTFKRGKISDGRVAKYELAALYLEEFFGRKKKLNEITKYNYQQYINWLGTEAGKRKNGLSKTTVEDQHTIVKTAILEALDMQYIKMNPTRNVKIIGREAEHDTVDTLSQADAGKLLDTLRQAPDSASKYFCLLQFYTGARYGEVAALRWDDDIDAQKEIVKIDKAFKYDRGNYRFGPPKSKASYRDIDAHKNLFTLLKKWKALQAQEILKRKILNPQNLIFVSEKNTWPISNSNINKYLKYWCKKAGVPRIRTHSFRHIRSDFLVLCEADPVYIAQQLGHASVQQSYEYASTTEDRRKKNKEKFEEYFKNVL